MAMILPPFEGSRLKVKRADEHIADLEWRYAVFAARCPQALPDPTWDGFQTWHWSLTVPEQPPVELSLIIGDAVHNLRTALDLAIVDCFRVVGKSDRGASFPFAKDEADLDIKMLQGSIRRLPKEITNLIKSFKSFKGGNRLLRQLHDIDNLDKHDLVLLTAAPLAVNDFEVRSGARLIKIDKGATFVPGNREIKEFLAFSSDTPIVIYGQKEVAINFVLMSPDLSVTQSVFDFLKGCSKLCCQIIETLRGALLGGNDVPHSSPLSDSPTIDLG